MITLLVVLLVGTGLLSLVTAGLLRSHADILRALHDLGAGVGDPTGDTGVALAAPSRRRTGPALPSERSSTSVHDLEGVSPDGDAVVTSMGAAPLTLVAFLTSGCASCAGFWSALADPAQLRLLPPGVRVVIVTKGPEWESPAAIAARAPDGIPVIMSTAAWADYEVPGSPFFALVDGVAGVRAGEGTAAAWAQVADLVHRAQGDAGGAGAGRGPRPSVRLNGADREKANDDALRSAGIPPGHPSLYPRRLGEVAAEPAGQAVPPAPARS